MAEQRETGTQVPRLLEGGLTGRIFVVTRYTETPDGFIVAIDKHDVTDDFNMLCTMLGLVER